MLDDCGFAENNRDVVLTLAIRLGLRKILKFREKLNKFLSQKLF